MDEIIKKIDELNVTIADSETMDELISKKAVMEILLSKSSKKFTVGDKVRKSNGRL